MSEADELPDAIASAEDRLKASYSSHQLAVAVASMAQQLTGDCQGEIRFVVEEGHLYGFSRGKTSEGPSIYVADSIALGEDDPEEAQVYNVIVGAGPIAALRDLCQAELEYTEEE